MVKSKADDILGTDPQDPFISNCLYDDQIGKFRIL